MWFRNFLNFILRRSSPLWDARKARRNELAAELRHWINEGTGELAAVLGERGTAKLRLARLTLHELETNGPDHDAIEELRKDTDLGEFAHRIEMLDAQPWSHDHNFDLMMRGIGELRPIGVWHTPGGPLAWGDADPAHKPKVEQMLARIETWLSGAGDPELGAQDAYREKVWLARCLATYLRYHLRDYWDWLERTAAVRRVGSRVWIEGVPPERQVKGIWHFDGCPASLRAALEFKGVEEKYLDDTIFAAILGQPFRFWFSDDFASCLAYTHEAPLGVIAAETLGFDHVWRPGGFGDVNPGAVARGDATLDREAVQNAWQELRQTLDGGHPVVVFGGAPRADLKAGPRVIVGRDDERGLVFFVPHTTWEPAPAWDDADPQCAAGIKEQGYRACERPDEANWIGSAFSPGMGMGGAAASFFAFRDRARSPSEHEVAVAILQRAVAIGRGDVLDETRPHRKGGLEALDLLAATLDQDGEIRRRDPDWWYAMEGLGWPEYRRTAARFVSRCGTDFGTFSEAQKAHLKAAARAYEESATHFDALWKCFLSVGPLETYEDHVKTIDAALASRGFRTKAADIVRLIRTAEEKAIAGIEEALRAGKPEAPRRAKLERLAQHDHHPYDPFSLTMQAVAAAFGRDVDYEAVYALSTNCFAPDIRPDEECRITWRMRGRGQCLDLAADRLGLDVRPLGCFSPRQYGQRNFPRAEKAKEAVVKIREALAGGEVVITDSGWLHDFNLWGIVTEVQGDGTLIGVTPNGRMDNTFDHFCSFWALSAKGHRLPGREADLLMLRRAVARIRADADPFLPESLACGLPAIGGPEVPGAVIWGLAAMDRWIEQMEQVPYQQDDADSSVGNARLCAWHTLHGAQVAAGQLRACADRLGGKAGPLLRSAADRYDRMARLLSPAVTGRGGEHYKEIMKDPAKQKAHAGVLRQMKAELATAAEETEKALAEVGFGEPLKVVALPGNVELELVLVPAGSFMMGSEAGEDPEKPVHEVAVTKPFYMGKYEVTQEQWQAVTGENPSKFVGEADSPRRPAERMSWYDIKREFLPRLQKYAPEGWAFRLPTEAEWEYACRAGAKTEHPYGDDYGLLGEYCWFKDNSGWQTNEVGRKKPNAWGLYDTLGNVYEFVEDWYDERYYEKGPRNDPCNTTLSKERVARGGAYFKGGCRATERRHGQPPYFANGSFGFRLALSRVADDKKAGARREEGQVVVEHFPADMDYQVRSFGSLLALRDCLLHEGVATTWSDLLGYSGDAFGCDGMSYDSVRAHDAVVEAGRAYGFDCRWRFGVGDPPYIGIRSQLDQGKPVLVGGGLFKTTCWYFVVVLGHDVPKKQFLVAGRAPRPTWIPEPAEEGKPGWNAQCPWATDAPKRDGAGVPANWQDSPQLDLGERRAMLPAAERFVDALRLGVSSYGKPQVEFYFFGEKSRFTLGRAFLVEWPQLLHKWSAKIRQKPIDPNDGDPLRPGYFNPLAISVRRRAAAAFLRRHAPELPEQARPHLEAAAERYEGSAAAADRMFKRLYKIEQVEDLDWYGKLLLVEFYIGEGENMTRRVADYAEAHPDRWAARTAVIGRINETFADDAAVGEACRLAGEILRSDDAAIAEVEKALAKAEGRSSF